MSDPVSESLSLVAELRRMQLRALVLVHRAKSARALVQKSIENTKAPVAAGAGKGNNQ